MSKRTTDGAYGPPIATRPLGAGLSLIVGAAATALSYVLGMPGDGSFVWTSVLLGALAGFAVGTVLGIHLVLLGAALLAVVLTVAGAASGGLLALIVAVIGGLLAAGYLAGWVTRQLVGRRADALRDRWILASLAALAGFAVIALWLASELGRNPP